MRRQGTMHESVLLATVQGTVKSSSTTPQSGAFRTEILRQPSLFQGKLGAVGLL